MEILAAKKFFIDRIVAQAKSEGSPLDSLETKLLHFTETGTDACQEYLTVSEEFDRERDTEEYEERVASLLVNAYEAEIATAKQQRRLKEAEEAYRQAYTALKREDHYVLVMIDKGLARRLRKNFMGIF